MKNLFLKATFATLIFFVNATHANNSVPNVFAFSSIKSCAQSHSKEYCICEADLMYDSLTDKEKELSILISALELNNLDLNQDDLYKLLLEQHDYDASILKEIGMKRDKISKETDKKCKK